MNKIKVMLAAVAASVLAIGGTVIGVAKPHLALAGNTYSCYDELTAQVIGASTKTYENKTVGRYACNSMTSKEGGIQLRVKNNNSGIVTITSPGVLSEIKLSWTSETYGNRSIDIYTKNTAYTGPVDLYSEESAGTLIGSIAYPDTAWSTTAALDYIGIKSHEGSLYISALELHYSQTK